jgi:hypothetical protein
MVVNNDDWLGKLEYIPFLRDIGRHFTINRMLTMDSVRLRLEREQPLTFLEFNYMILQGYDFVELNKRHGCTLQMGGSDQWGNIVQGVELGRRVRDAELFGLTSPLITTSSGAKMGKTASGAVWLNPKRLSPYDYWQFWRNTEDADVGRFLRMFTELPLEEIARLEALRDAEINEAKKILANEATRLCHGPERPPRRSPRHRRRSRAPPRRGCRPSRSRPARVPPSPRSRWRSASPARAARRAGSSSKGACGSTTRPSRVSRRASAKRIWTPAARRASASARSATGSSGVNRTTIPR